MGILDVFKKKKSASSNNKTAIINITKVIKVPNPEINKIFGLIFGTLKSPGINFSPSYN